jgi:hypothetical protein
MLRRRERFVGSAIAATASGQGSLAFGASVGVTDFYYEIVTAGPAVQYLAIGPLERLYHAGWIGFGYATGGIGGGPYVGYGLYAQYQAEDHRGPNGTWFAVGDTLFWDLTPGTVMYIEADW